MPQKFPTIEEVIAIHDLLIEEIGGASGLRDEGALASAVLRPQMGYYNGLIEEAAALMESLSQNQPFIDGNKRVALVMTDVFLRMNGFYINSTRDAAYAFFMRMYETGSFRFANLVPWLEEHVNQLP